MEKRTKYNSGYACYIGTKRVAWDVTLDDAIESARQVVAKQPTKNRFVPAVTIFDCDGIEVVGMVTDDSNGITYHSNK